MIERLPSLTPITHARRACGVLLTRAEWTRQLLAAIDAEQRCNLPILRLDQRQAAPPTTPDAAVRKQALALLKRGGGVAQCRSAEGDRRVHFDDQGKGRFRGRQVDPFRSNVRSVTPHSGEGTNIGPDLTGMAVHPKEELIIDILDPSRSVEGNFRLYKINTKSGKVLLPKWMLAGESRTAVELVDTEGKKQTVLREEIEELIGSNKSLMPDGFEKQISRKELTDLLEFLTTKGKYLPLPLNKVATAVSTKGMFYSEEASQQERFVFADWKPSTCIVENVPFVLVDPQGDKAANVILLNGPEGSIPPKMPKTVTLPCGTPAKAIHLLQWSQWLGLPVQRKGARC